MKRILTVIASIVIAAAVFTACGKSNNDTNTTKESNGMSEAESKADKVGDDLGNGVREAASGAGGAVNQAGNAVSDALD